jgi:hypothetical protein
VSIFIYQTTPVCREVSKGGLEAPFTVIVSAHMAQRYSSMVKEKVLHNSFHRNNISMVIKYNLSGLYLSNTSSKGRENQEII